MAQRRWTCEKGYFAEGAGEQRVCIANIAPHLPVQARSAEQRAKLVKWRLLVLQHTDQVIDDRLQPRRGMLSPITSRIVLSLTLLPSALCQA